MIIGALLIGISSNDAGPLVSDFPLPFLIDVTMIFFFLNSTAADFGSDAEICPVIFFQLVHLRIEMLP